MHLFSPLFALILSLAPVFSPPDTGWVPFSGTTEEGTVKLCNGLIVDHLTIVSTRGAETHTEHVYIAYSGKLYDLANSITH